MRDDGAWLMCRVGYVETMRAVGLAAGAAATRALREEWASFAVVEVDQRLADAAGEPALGYQLRSLDALHLAAATLLPADDLVVAAWDRRLHAAAIELGLRVLPQTLPGAH